MGIYTGMVKYPHSIRPGVVLDKNRDGIRLAVGVYKPAGLQEPWPAILAYSPFQKVRSFESANPALYRPKGYVCVQAAERGSGFNGDKALDVYHNKC
jgi:predicted acyl esterase